MNLNLIKQRSNHLFTGNIRDSEACESWPGQLNVSIWLGHWMPRLRVKLVLGVAVRRFLERLVFKLADEQNRWPSSMSVGIIQSSEGLKRTKTGEMLHSLSAGLHKLPHPPSILGAPGSQPFRPWLKSVPSVLRFSGLPTTPPFLGLLLADCRSWGISGSITLWANTF